MTTVGQASLFLMQLAREEMLVNDPRKHSRALSYQLPQVPIHVCEKGDFRGVRYYQLCGGPAEDWIWWQVDLYPVSTPHSYWDNWIDVDFSDLEVLWDLGQWQVIADMLGVQIMRWVIIADDLCCPTLSPGTWLSYHSRCVMRGN